MTLSTGWKILIRKAQPEDAAAIGSLFRSVVHEGNAFLSDETVELTEVLTTWFADKASAFVAEVDGGVVGAYLLKPNAHGRGAHIANGTYMVHPRWRGRGIGRALGEHSLAVAKQDGYVAMQFNHVVSTNTTSIRLWQQLGFATLGIVPKGFRLPNGNLVDVYIMYRFLDAEIRPMERQTARSSVDSGTHWEEIAGYCRAVRVGDTIHVAGTTATDETGALVGGDDPAAQARYALQKIERAIRALGGDLRDVVRTRIFVSDVAHWEPVARVHGEVFKEIRPVNTLVEARLVGEEYLVEIEAEAIVMRNP